MDQKKIPLQLDKEKIRILTVRTAVKAGDSCNGSCCAKSSGPVRQ